MLLLSNEKGYLNREKLIKRILRQSDKKSGQMKIMSTSSGASDSDDSCKDQYASLRKLAMVQLQPPRNPNKPFTSFGIKDILGHSCASNHRNIRLNTNTRIVRPWDSRSSPSRDSDLSSDPEDEEINVDDDEPIPALKTVSPLDALMEMANKTFQGLETAESAEAKKREQAALFGKHQPPKKRRKSRTAFTNQQIYELEKRFLYQKYLTPADRDEIAQNLGLTNAQVITWFQNRRAKLKRDLEELKNDVTAAVQNGEPTADLLKQKLETALKKNGCDVDVNLTEDDDCQHSPSKIQKTSDSEDNCSDREEEEEKNRNDLDNESRNSS